MNDSQNVVIPFGLPRPVAEQAIHRLAAEGKYAFEDDFLVKLDTRAFSMRQVIETIKAGTINQGPTRDSYGDWRCRVKKRVAGRLVRVVVAITASLDFMQLVSVH